MIFSRSAIVVNLCAAATSAQKATKVKISIQPVFHAIPVYAALEFGWFEELGLEVELSLYASGGPQVKDAVENKAWDLGLAGSVPNVLAGAQGISTIGISNEASATTEVFTAPGVTEWPPSNLYNGIFSATADSTGELLLRKCLDAAGIGFDDNHVSEAPQSEIIKNLNGRQFLKADQLNTSGLPSYGSLWAPNTYKYEEEHPRNIKVVCSGLDVDFPIYTGLMVRDDYAAENTDVVAKILAAFLRGVSYMQNKAMEEDVIETSRAFHIFAGNPVTETALKEDLILRPLFNLDQQLDAMNRNFANNYESQLDRHYLELEEFLFNHNVIEKKFLPKEYVSDRYMKMVSDDAKLRAFSYSGAGVYEQSGDGSLEAAFVAGIVLIVVGFVTLTIALALCCKVRANKTATVPVEGGDENPAEADASSMSWRK